MALYVCVLQLTAVTPISCEVVLHAVNRSPQLVQWIHGRIGHVGGEDLWSKAHVCAMQCLIQCLCYKRHGAWGWRWFCVLSIAAERSCSAAWLPKDVLAQRVLSQCWASACIQVKAEEQKYSTQMRQLESQLEAALLAAEQQQPHADTDMPLIDVDSAAEKTLQLLDRMLQVREMLTACQRAGLEVVGSLARVVRDKFMGTLRHTLGQGRKCLQHDQQLGLQTAALLPRLEKKLCMGTFRVLTKVPQHYRNIASRCCQTYATPSGRDMSDHSILRYIFCYTCQT